jgi:hypothetical protein
MRPRFSDRLERGRVRTGFYATEPADKPENWP